MTVEGGGGSVCAPEAARLSGWRLWLLEVSAGLAVAAVVLLVAALAFVEKEFVYQGF